MVVLIYYFQRRSILLNRSLIIYQILDLQFSVILYLPHCYYFSTIALKKGKQVFVSNNKDEIRLISAPYQQCDDGKMHVITLVRNGSRFDWSVDGHHTIYIDNCKFPFKSGGRGGRSQKILLILTNGIEFAFLF